MPDVRVTHPEKVLFPDTGLTKAELVAYYRRVAPLMIPHVRGRPVSMQRFPDGVGSKGFFHKDIPGYFPDWLERGRVAKSGGWVTHPVITNVDSLAYLANQNTITPHVWLSRADRPRRPDRLVIDLDPSRDDFAEVRRAARDIGDLLSELGLPRFAMVTGSRGIHLWVPIRRDRDQRDVRAFAEQVAALAEERWPQRLTTAFRKEKRDDKILVDVARNGYAQTVVPPYAVRARANASVAMPLEWRELSDSKLRPDRWTVRNAFRRIGRKGDPWTGMTRAAVSLARAERKLAEI